MCLVEINHLLSNIEAMNSENPQCRQCYVYKGLGFSFIQTKEILLNLHTFTYLKRVLKLNFGLSLTCS